MCYCQLTLSDYTIIVEALRLGQNLTYKAKYVYSLVSVEDTDCILSRPSTSSPALENSTFRLFAAS